MNVSCQWLAELVETGLAPKEIAEILTNIGLNVDATADLPGGDTQLLVEVTSNRGDCLGHVGVARELAAAVGKPLRLPEIRYDESDEPVETLTQVKVEDLDLCPLYTARVIRGVKIGSSPAWMQARLEAVGVRPVNNVVDVTNYVMMECGQPLHAFDYAYLAEHRIVVRRAKEGERFVAIDHSEHTLSPDRLVIADARRAVALAGVMGGADSEISDRTVNVLLESAVFDPSSIRGTARAAPHDQRVELPLREARRPVRHRLGQPPGVPTDRQQVAGGRVAHGVASAEGRCPSAPKWRCAWRGSKRF